MNDPGKIQYLRVHCFMHVPYEGLGYIETWLNQQQIEPSYTRFYENMSVPNVDDVDFLIIMGGPMSVYEDDKYDWMAQEKLFIREAIATGKIVLGICLGSQLIAEALGAKVYPNHQKEIGWFDISKTEEGKRDKMLETIAETMRIFHWHGDTYNLPANSRHLFYSANCKHQAFMYTGKVLGLQFHPEINQSLISGLLEAGKDELSTKTAGIQSAEEIMASSSWSNEANQLMHTFLDYLTAQNK